MKLSAKTPFNLDKMQTIHWIVGSIGVLLLPWWLLKLWEALRSFDKPPKPRPALAVKKIAEPKRFWHKGPVLFLIGSVLTLLGFVLTILLRNPEFLILIVVGPLFLSALFFYTYFVIFSRDERALFSSRKNARAEHLMLFTHPAWMFHYPRFAIIGMGFIAGGIFSGVIYSDIYFALLAIYGLIFMMHLWSFTQLNILTVTDRRISLRTGLPADSIVNMPLAEIANTQVTQSLLQKICRVHALSITDRAGASIAILVTRSQNPSEKL